MFVQYLIRLPFPFTTIFILRGTKAMVWSITFAATALTASITRHLQILHNFHFQFFYFVQNETLLAYNEK